MSTPVQEARSRQTVSLAGPLPTLPASVPAHPVIGLRRLPTSDRHLFDDFQGKGKPKSIVLIGAAEDCDIRLEDPAVSARHCLIQRDRHHARVYVHDAGSRNGTMVDGIAVRSAELQEGSVLTVGSTSLCAISAPTAKSGIVIAAITLGEFLARARRAYGSVRATARGLGILHTTLNNWLQTNRFGMAEEGAAAPIVRVRLDGEAQPRLISDSHVTASLDGRAARAAELVPEYPVIGLRALATRDVYRLDDFQVKGKPKRLISIGTGRDRDIRLRDPTVSATHCMLRRDRASGRVYVLDCGSRNGTQLGGMDVSMSELCEGSVLTLGTTRLCAISARTQDASIIIAASTFRDFLRRAKAAYGSIRAAAQGIGMSPSTLADWFHNNRFGLRDDSEA